jgi:hypothetical protein
MRTLSEKQPKVKGLGVWPGNLEAMSSISRSSFSTSLSAFDAFAVLWDVLVGVW